MTTNEALVADWLAREMCAELLVQRDGETLVFHGDTQDFLIEIRAFGLGHRTETKRLTEPAIDLGYN